ncbi:MAG: hypothetical protein WA919_01100, partial [Coleofasciculaceae cyanobacterium]
PTNPTAPTICSTKGTTKTVRKEAFFSIKETKLEKIGIDIGVGTLGKNKASYDPGKAKGKRKQYCSKSSLFIIFPDTLVGNLTRTSVDFLKQKS